MNFEKAKSMKICGLEIFCYNLSTSTGCTCTCASFNRNSVKNNSFIDVLT